MGVVHAFELACVLCGRHILNEWGGQQICIRFCVKLEHSFMETIWVIQKATSMDNWWLAASSWQCACSCIMSRVAFFGKTSNYPDDSATLQPRFGAVASGFSQSKITFEREEISDHRWDSGKYNGTADGNWEHIRQWCPLWRRLRHILSYAWHILYLVSSSRNVSIFHIAWAGYFLDRPCVAIITNKYLYVSVITIPFS